jgi:branched-chain amino acid transport system permease protein
VLAPLVVGRWGRCSSATALRKVHKYGHVPELLITFGLSYVVLELVQLVWGRWRWTSAARGPAGPGVHLDQHEDRGLELVWGAAARPTVRAADAAVRVVCSPFPPPRIHDAGGGG